MKKHFRIITFLLITLTACSMTTTPTPEPAVKSPTQSLTFKNTIVSLTFDDGDADNYAIRDTLSKNNLHATFYIVSGFIGQDGYMTVSQLQNLYADGNEIGGHSLSHAELPDLDGEKLWEEICQDRMNLLTLGFDVVSFAYPFGHYDEESEQVVRDCGYHNARGIMNGPDVVPPNDLFGLQAMPYIVADTRLPKMKRYVTDVEQGGGGWAIFVFHHVCDDCNKFSVSPQLFDEFAAWLHEQQSNGLVVKTVGEVIGGEILSEVSP